MGHSTVDRGPTRMRQQRKRVVSYVSISSARTSQSIACPLFSNILEYNCSEDFSFNLIFCVRACSLTTHALSSPPDSSQSQTRVERRESTKGKAQSQTSKVETERALVYAKRTLLQYTDVVLQDGGAGSSQPESRSTVSSRSQVRWATASSIVCMEKPLIERPLSSQ